MNEQSDQDHPMSRNRLNTADTVAFHLSQATHHQTQAAEHRQRGEIEAAEAHAKAADAHLAAAVKPVSERATNAAMLAAGKADQATQKARRS